MRGKVTSFACADCSRIHTSPTGFWVVADVDNPRCKDLSRDHQNICMNTVQNRRLFRESYSMLLEAEIRLANTPFTSPKWHQLCEERDKMKNAFIEFVESKL